MSEQTPRASFPFATTSSSQPKPTQHSATHTTSKNRPVQVLRELHQCATDIDSRSAAVSHGTDESTVTVMRDIDSIEETLLLSSSKRKLLDGMRIEGTLLLSGQLDHNVAFNY